MSGHIIEFYVYYDESLKASNYIHAYSYHDNRKFNPDKYGRYKKVYEMLNKMKVQSREKKGKILVRHYNNNKCVNHEYDNYEHYIKLNS